MMRLRYLGVVFLCACARPSNSPPATGTATGATSPPKSVPLPGVNGPVTLDYIVYDHAHERVWIPVGESGSADIFDIGASSFQRVDGFATVPREVRGRKRMMGPSAAAVGDGFVYIGNRATSEVCVVDESTLVLGACVKLSAPTDGVAYVPPTKEVWVTTPKDRSLVVLDASQPDRLQPKLVIRTEGEPEGYAVDSEHGLFYTNLGREPYARVRHQDARLEEDVANGMRRRRASWSRHRREAKPGVRSLHRQRANPRCRP
jgi:DNA-binding beta-propeller fold protein YncE